MTVSRSEQARTKPWDELAGLPWGLQGKFHIYSEPWESSILVLSESAEFQREMDFGNLSLKFPTQRSIISFMCCFFFITAHAISNEESKMKSQAVHILLHVAVWCGESSGSSVPLSGVIRYYDFMIGFRQIRLSRCLFFFALYSFKGAAQALHSPPWPDLDTHQCLTFWKNEYKGSQPFSEN